MGNIYKMLNNYDNALTFYDKAIKLDPTNYLTYNNIGTCYYSKCEYQKAEEMYIKALEYNNQCSIVYNNLGNLYWKVLLYIYRLVIIKNL